MSTVTSPPLASSTVGSFELRKRSEADAKVYDESNDLDIDEEVKLIGHFPENPDFKISTYELILAF